MESLKHQLQQLLASHSCPNCGASLAKLNSQLSEESKPRELNLRQNRWLHVSGKRTAGNIPVATLDLSKKKQPAKPAPPEKVVRRSTNGNTGIATINLVKVLRHKACQ